MNQFMKEVQAFETTWNDVLNNTYHGSKQQQMVLEMIVGPFAMNLNNACGGDLVADCMAGNTQAVSEDLTFLLEDESDYYDLMNLS
ncbi:MAG: hypothetical protein AB7N99_03725 [Simkaniaceae bacterium]